MAWHGLGWASSANLGCRLITQTYQHQATRMPAEPGACASLPCRRFTMRPTLRCPARWPVLPRRRPAPLPQQTPCACWWRLTLARCRTATAGNTHVSLAGMSLEAAASTTDAGSDTACWAPPCICVLLVLPAHGYPWPVWGAEGCASQALKAWGMPTSPQLCRPTAPPACLPHASPSPEYDYWVQQGVIGSHAVVRAMTEVARNLTTRPHVQLLVGDIPYSVSGLTTRRAGGRAAGAAVDQWEAQ